MSKRITWYVADTSAVSPGVAHGVLQQLQFLGTHVEIQGTYMFIRTEAGENFSEAVQAEAIGKICRENSIPVKTTENGPRL